MSEQLLLKNVEGFLNRELKEHGFTDYSMQIKPGANEGDGFNGDLFGIIVRDKLSDKRLDLLYKTGNSSTAKLLFKSEVFVYSEVLPIFEKFQSVQKLSGNNKFSSYVKCYAAVADDESDRFIVIMEDLRVHGFQMWNKYERMPIENTRLIMRDLGKLHGLSIAMKDQQPKEFSIIKQTDDVYATICQQFMEENFYRYFDCTIDALKNEHYKNIMRYVKNNYSAYVKRCINDETADQFIVFSHGDLWNNNVMFRYDQDGKVCDCRFVDWQQSRYASLAIDLIYFIFSSSDKAVRDKEYENFIRTYYESVVEMITLLGMNPAKLFTFEELKAERKRCGNFALTMMPILIHGSAAHQVVDKKPEIVLNIQLQSEYNRRINEVVEDILTLGFYRNITIDA